MVLLLVSFLLAVISWRFVETPFRRGFKGASTLRLATGAVVSAVIVIAFAYWVRAERGFPERFPPTIRHLADPLTPRPKSSVALRSIRSGRLPVLGERTIDSQPPDFLVWGDSHAMVMSSSFDSFAHDHALRGVFVARSGTAPILGVWQPRRRGYGMKSLEWKDAVFDYIRDNSIRNIMLVSRWSLYIEGERDGRQEWLLAPAGTNETDKEAAQKALEAGLDRTLVELDKLGVRVWIFTQVPHQKMISPQRAIVLSQLLDRDLPNGISRSEHDAEQRRTHEVLSKVVDRHENATLIDLGVMLFGSNRWSQIGSAEGTFYRDDDHLSSLGTEQMVRPLLDSVLRDFTDGGNR